MYCLKREYTIWLFVISFQRVQNIVFILAILVSSWCDFTNDSSALSYDILIEYEVREGEELYHELSLFTLLFYYTTRRLLSRLRAREFNTDSHRSSFQSQFKIRG